ncbi:hypothetical protein B0H63DRAFT_483678 [Podospora didyma]|uniref:DUF6590 domain-containing protein n=1 Tax=Podospora didyma TaxID=330526 RepID=A0AAE0K8E4_9PEZI|nr:hypothetical protein B0H63DRAFT_483678 [Podospora didyma]
MASPVSPNKESHGAYAAAQRRIVERSSSEYATSLASEAGAESDASQDSHADQASTSRRNSTESDRTSISSGESEVLPSYEGPLEDGFKRVDKPKRFFSIGRIFKTVWFEPGGDDTPARRSDIDWTESCPPYYEQRPYAKFRWFVVVRRRLHHSLCFSITASAGPGAARASRGRPIDFVVLHSSAVEPPDPFEGEGITRAPIAIIIEDEEAYISPLARIDCARIYTVEDNLQVLKVGRVHPDWLPKLEEYFKEAAA